MTDKVQLVLDNLNNKKEGIDGEIIADCPFCGKKANENKFYYNKNKGVYKCHSGKCSQSGSTEMLLNHFNISKSSNEPTWIYTDENNNPIHGVTRTSTYGKKSYFQVQFKNGEWVNGIKNVEIKLYNLPKVQDSQKIYIVEGEKCAEKLEKKFNVTATTNSGGAGKWKTSYNKYFADKEIIILPDNDEPGRKHGNLVADNLSKISKSIKVVQLPVCAR